MEGVATSNHVYVKHDEYAWIPARLLEIEGDKATVSIAEIQDENDIHNIHTSNKLQTLQTIELKDYENQNLPLQNVDEDGRLRIVQDMVDLPYLHEAAILYNLKLRHKHQQPYTRTGDIIIAVNPYQWLNHLYNEETRHLYSSSIVFNSTHHAAVLPPHVYETSCCAYRGLANGQDQSILVSGESGAGKTETVKILLSDIASIQTKKTPIVQKILDSNPLLEAFGNAKTIRNDNSSRFGKYIYLQFDVEDPFTAAYSGRSLPLCQLAGSKCEVYLLEKSRVVLHEEEERTYHVFYQLLSAPNDIKTQFWNKLEDTDNESFAYVGYTDTSMIEGKSDCERFERTLASLALVGIEHEKLVMLMRALCIVLQLGNLVFDEESSSTSNNNDASEITSETELTNLAELMGVDAIELSANLTVRTMKARNETFKVPLNAVSAKDSCDAFAKEIYAKAFLWLVRTINDATCAENHFETSKTFGIIGLLDIFGFESFETNRFEQLCINYANEKLQQKFTQDIFRSVQAEYEYEGIELAEIEYSDNSDVLDLVEGRMGLIAFLNEECVRPGGSDKGFVSKAAAMNKDNAKFIWKKGFDDCEFGVFHYAGQVIYNANSFVTKNMDTLPTDLQVCATKSSNGILAHALGNDSVMNVATMPAGKQHTPRGKLHPSPAKRKGSNLVGETVWSKFKNQLNSLMTNLKETRTRYIRCIKPNSFKKPQIMQHKMAVEQLRCAGVVAAVTISRSAFPNRLEHDIVLDRFKPLWKHHPDIDDDDEECAKRQVDQMLTVALKSLETTKDGNTVKAFVMGKSRTYFRAGTLEYLENERVKALSSWAVVVQSVGRRCICRSRFTRGRKVAICVESLIRMFLVRRRFLTERRAAIQMECWCRCILAERLLLRLRRNYKATLLQTHWRMAMAATRFRAHRRAAISVQRIVRGSLQRPKYRAALIEKREEAKLENQILALQRKLEEAEKRRVEAERKAEAIAVAEGDRKLVEEKKEEGHMSAASSLSNPDEMEQISAEQISAHQQTLMDESGKMLEYLRKEVFKLRSQNAQMRRDFDLLKDNNQRLMDANASAGASFAALNQHAKQLAKANEKMTGDLHTYKTQVQKLSVSQVELKEELKMKQATYIAEVHSRLQYQKALSRIIDVAQEKCRDDRLVEEFLRIADACDAEYMSGPTGIGSPRKKETLMSSIRNLWS